jgi:hypothetical protein
MAAQKARQLVFGVDNTATLSGLSSLAADLVTAWCTELGPTITPQWNVVAMDDKAIKVGEVPTVPLGYRSPPLELLRASEFLENLKNLELLPLTRQIAPLFVTER